MNIGVIGSGGREHSLCFKLLQSKKVDKIFCIPGNAGTGEICKNLDDKEVSTTTLDKIVKENNIPLPEIRKVFEIAWSRLSPSLT